MNGKRYPRHRFRPGAMLCVCLLCLFVAVPDIAHALSADGHRDPAALFLAASSGTVPWESLSNQERKLLQKHRRNWSGYPAEKQQRLQDGARHYLELPPEQRRNMEHKRQQYEKMSPAERRELRERYQRQRH